MFSEEPEEFIILSAFKDAGEYFYRVKSVDAGTIVDLPLRSLYLILHRKTRVIDATKKFRLVKKTQGSA